jgi:hypothetical protein
MNLGNTCPRCGRDYTGNQNDPDACSFDHIVVNVQIMFDLYRARQILMLANFDNRLEAMRAAQKEQGQ